MVTVQSESNLNKAEKVRIKEDHKFFGSCPICSISPTTEGLPYPTLPTVVWSKAMPLTASCLSPLPGFESQPGHVRKNSVT